MKRVLFLLLILGAPSAHLASAREVTPAEKQQTHLGWQAYKAGNYTEAQSHYLAAEAAACGQSFPAWHMLQTIRTQALQKGITPLVPARRSDMPRIADVQNVTMHYHFVKQQPAAASHDEEIASTQHTASKMHRSNLATARKLDGRMAAASQISPVGEQTTVVPQYLVRCNKEASYSRIR